MLFKKEFAFSLLEVVIGLAILVIAGGMISRGLVLSGKANQEMSAKGASRDILKLSLQKIRKELNVRNSSIAITSSSTSLQMSIPLSASASNNYQLSITTKCRTLPPGVTLDLSQVVSGLSCLQKFKCGEGIPYIEWSYTNHPQLTVEMQPELPVFQRELNKEFGSPSYGLCFSQSADAITIEGLQLNLKTEGMQRKAILASQTMVIPLSKRNHIEIVP